MSNNIIGLRELQSKLNKLKDIKKNTDALLAGAFVLQAGSQRRAPVDTGFLRASASSQKTDKGAEMSFAANYAYYQEFGTSKMAAQPFVRPTIDEDGDKIIKAVADQLQKDIDSMVGG